MPDLWTVGQVARHYGVDAKRVYEWIARGNLTAACEGPVRLVADDLPDWPTSREIGPKAARAASLAATAEQLRGSPGRWALVLRGVRRAAAWRITQGKPACFAPAGDFEAVARAGGDTDGADWDIWARYVGRG